MSNKISALHGTHGLPTHEHEEVNTDASLGMQQLQELLSANNRQKEAEDAAMFELQAELRSDPDLMRSAVKSLWDNRPGLLIMGLRQRGEMLGLVAQERAATEEGQGKLKETLELVAQERAAKQECAARLQETLELVAQERAAKDRSQMKLQEALQLAAQERAAKEDSQLKLKDTLTLVAQEVAAKKNSKEMIQELEACWAAEKLKAADTTCTVSKHVEVAQKFRKQLQELEACLAAEKLKAADQVSLVSKYAEEQRTLSGLAGESSRAALERVSALEKSLREARDSHRAAQVQADSLQEQIQVLAEAEQRAKALADLHETANMPLQKRITKLEKSAKAKSERIIVLEQEVASATEREAVANAAAAQACADAEGQMQLQYSKNTAEVAALRAQLEGLQNSLAAAANTAKTTVHSEMDREAHVTEQEARPVGSAEQPCVKEAGVGEAEQGSSEQAGCELCEEGVHSKEDCPLVVAAQESTCAATPEAEGADWQVVAAKASRAQTNGNKRGKGTKGGNGSKAHKGKGCDKKSGHATKVVLAHKDGPNGWVPVKEASGNRNGSGSKQPEFT